MENPLYAKIVKWISLALLLISVVLSVWAFTRFGAGDVAKEAAVNTMLYWAYAMLIFALVAVLCIGLYVAVKTDPKSLVRIGIALAGAAILCLVAFLLASGKPAIGLTNVDPTPAQLKLTDTVLNLTYILGGCAIFAIIFGEVFSAIRNKKA